MKPLIGLCGSVDAEQTQQFLLRDYFSAVLRAGGLPVLLSMDMDEEARADCLSRLDGLMLAGGNDVDPTCYCENPVRELGEVNSLRDGFELALLPQAMKLDMPVLGICRGIQVMNVALGGTLYQDLPTQRADSRLIHRQEKPYDKPSHAVSIRDGSLLSNILGTNSFCVNSMHHQAVRDVAPALHTCAQAEDGVTEAVESDDRSFFLGVQWHPERMPADREATALFEAFVGACEQYALKKGK